MLSTWWQFPGHWMRRWSLITWCVNSSDTKPDLVCGVMSKALCMGAQYLKLDKWNRFLTLLKLCLQRCCDMWELKTVTGYHRHGYGACQVCPGILWCLKNCPVFQFNCMMCPFSFKITDCCIIQHATIVTF